MIAASISWEGIRILCSITLEKKARSKNGCRWSFGEIQAPSTNSHPKTGMRVNMWVYVRSLTHSTFKMSSTWTGNLTGLERALFHKISQSTYQNYFFPLNLLYLTPNTKKKEKTATVWNRIGWFLGWTEKITLMNKYLSLKVLSPAKWTARLVLRFIFKLIKCTG